MGSSLLFVQQAGSSNRQLSPAVNPRGGSQAPLSHDDGGDDDGCRGAPVLADDAQFAVPYALQADEPAGEALDRGGLAVHDQHFETAIVAAMGVTGGDHQLMVRMLKFGQLFRDAVRVVIVDKRDGAHDRCGRGGDAA